jgi:hypothetical protein
MAPLGITGSKSRVLNIVVGQELHVTLQTVGPGSYESPPSVSSAAMRFLSVGLVSPTVPAGPTQQFRFKGEAPGEAIIVFRHSGISPTVTDTVRVHGRR